MFLNLDSKELIRLEADDGDLTNKLRSLCSRTGSQVALSSTVIEEVAEPIRVKAGKSRVMALLNRIESLPHVWIRSVDLEAREVGQALSSCRGQAYQLPSPFVASYLDTLVDLRPDVRSYYGGKPLAWVVWEQLYGERASGPAASIGARYLAVMAKDREMVKGWSADTYRAKMITPFARKVDGLTGSPKPGPVFAEYLWKQPGLCPGLRLGFEVWHLLVRDTATVPRASDLEDLVRITALPYGDVFTCDKRMGEYLRQMRTSDKYGLRECNYWGRVTVANSMDDVVKVLEEAA